ncbi:hypothetical protein PTKIN_Ptkin02bG0151200 [Pterospermum kingtungense]
MKDLMEGLSMSRDEDGDLDLLVDDNEARQQFERFALCLVGRLLTDRTVNFNSIQNRMADVWRPRKGVTVKDIGDGLFLFQFNHMVDLRRVSDGGPWSFDNHMLVLHHLQPEQSPAEIPSFFYDINNNSSVWREYMRIRVTIDVRLRLVRYKNIKKRDGSQGKVYFKYERLNTFCFVCSLLGHSKRFCSKQFEVDGSVVRNWDISLRVPNYRSVGQLRSRWLRPDGSGNVFVDDGGEESLVGEHCKVNPSLIKEGNLYGENQGLEKC